MSWNLRPYQAEAVDAVLTDWKAGETPVAVVLPTGAGKTRIFAALTARWLEEHGPFSGKVLVLVDRDELARQTASVFAALAPELRVGIVKAGENQVDADVVVASVQTLRRPGRLRGLTGVGMVIVDECDLSLAQGYLDIFDYFNAWHADGSDAAIPMVGVTATFERGDRRGLGTIYRKISYTRDIMYMIRNGYLADVRGLTVASEGLDLSRARKSRGDYREDDLGEIMGQSVVTTAIADAYLEHALRPDGRPRPGVHFAPTVASAHSQCDAYVRAGITAEVVSGETPLHDPDAIRLGVHRTEACGGLSRCAIYRRFAHGTTSILVNCMVLTRGWDAPHAEVAVMGRPTTSSSLWQQCVGRVLRLWRGKDKALVLDVVGGAKVHKLASLIDMSVWEPKDGESLLEAEERETTEETESAARRTRGPKYQKDGHLIEVNLFAESASAWLRTRKGVWFLNTRATTWFLWEHGDGSYGIATYINADYNGKPSMRQTGLPMELALSLAESDAMAADPSIASRSSSWRQGAQSPSDAQKQTALRWRITLPEGCTKAQASDLLSVAIASARIDQYVTS